MWCNFNRRRDNLIFDSNWFLVAGERFVREGRAYFHPASFMQANPEMFEKMMVRLKQLLPMNSPLLELYAGVGTIGLALVDECSSVHCVEIVKESLECFEASCLDLSEDLRKKILFKCEDAATQMELLKSFDGVVIVDPPRKGLHLNLLRTFCGLEGKGHLVYISCGWESFKRDCKALLHSGWSLKSADGFLFFPGSEHLEVLAQFVKEAR